MLTLQLGYILFKFGCRCYADAQTGTVITANVWTSGSRNTHSCGKKVHLSLISPRFSGVPYRARGSEAFRSVFNVIGKTERFSARNAKKKQ